MSSASSHPVAILYQAAVPPLVGGAVKPMKPGGYSDSGADIAFALRSLGHPVVTPVDKPSATQDFDWVWPDRAEGIGAAIARGATTLWANTVLFHGHPLERLPDGIALVGHLTQAVVSADDKFATNTMLRNHHLPVPVSFVVARPKAAGPAEIAVDTLTQSLLDNLGLLFPVVVKPLRGRGSQGVQVVHDLSSLAAAANGLLDARAPHDSRTPLYGERILIEEFLPGDEITIAVMPPGTYRLGSSVVERAQHWALPPVRRAQHHQDVLPYSGLVPIMENSVLISDDKARPQLLEILEACNRAAALVRASTLIRIDCRAARNGAYAIFDLNMKPNITGPGRPGRDLQDSLVSLAARGVGWDYPNFVLNLAQNAHTLKDLMVALATGCSES